MVKYDLWVWKDRKYQKNAKIDAKNQRDNLGKGKVEAVVGKLFKRLKQYFKLVSKLLKSSLGSLFNGTFGAVSASYQKNDLLCKILQSFVKFSGKQL